MRQIIITLSAIVALVSPAWGGSAIDELVSAAADGTVEISNISGTVQITGWERSELKLSGTLGAGAEGVELRSVGDRVLIDVEYPDRGGRHKRMEATHLQVMVPAGSRLEVSTVSADITVDGVRGHVELESVSGRISCRGTTSSARIESVSGAVEVEAALGRSEIETVSGRITVESANGSLDVESVSGTSEIRSGQLDRFDAETVSGSITIAAAPAPGARFDIEAHSGDVLVAMPAGSGAEFDVSTFSGAINNELGPSASRSDQYGPGKRLNFAHAGGGAHIRVSSFSGSVTLKAK